MPFTILAGAALIIAAETPHGSPSWQDSLHSITVVADRGLIVSRADTLEIKDGAPASDILQQSAGVYIGDYGGAAGSKYIDLRGLGTTQTAIYIDGIRVGNVQNGQNDLSNLGMEQFGCAVVDYAQNSVSFTTARPSFLPGRHVAGEASFAAGSFNSYDPHLRLDFKLGERVSLSANVAGTFSKGDFKYCDSLRRQNNDIRQWRTGIDAFGLTGRGKWHAKAHYSTSERGVAGAMNYPSSDRQADRDFFVQGYVEERFSNIYALSASAKYAFDRMDYSGEWDSSRYDRHETQINSSHRFRIAQWLALTFTADFVWAQMNSTAYTAERYAPTVALGAAFRTGRLRADIALKYDAYIDKGARSRNIISPSADLRYEIIAGLDINAFVRRAFRMPTFNELYFAGYGNPDLEPEDAWMSGIGLGLRKTVAHWTITADADRFFNCLSDKIISAPTRDNPNVWLPYNLGSVHSAGFDLSAGFLLATGIWSASFNAKYGYLSAVDKTVGSADYGEQIPFVARHSLILDGSVGIKGWKIDAAWNLRAGRRDGYGQAQDWNTLDATLSKTIAIRGCGPLTLFVCGRNLADCRYESVRYYPMPGISVTGGVRIKF